MHTPLSPTLTPIFCVCPSTQLPPKTLFLGIQNIVGGDLPLPLWYAYGVHDSHTAIHSTFPIRPAIRSAMRLVRFVKAPAIHGTFGKEKSQHKHSTVTLGLQHKKALIPANNGIMQYFGAKFSFSCCYTQHEMR